MANLAKKEADLVKREASFQSKIQRARFADMRAALHKKVSDKLVAIGDKTEKVLEWQHTGDVSAPLVQYSGLVTEACVNRKLGKGWAQAAALFGAAVEGVGLLMSIMEKRPKYATIFKVVAAFGNGLRLRMSVTSADSIAASIFG